MFAQILKGAPYGNTNAAKDHNGVLKPVDTNSPEFKNWFDGGVAANPDGTPMKLYHATAADISEFRDTNGIFLTPHIDYANQGNHGANRDGMNIMPVYTSLKNPKRVNVSDTYKLTAAKIDKYKKKGYDGLLGYLTNNPDNWIKEAPFEYVVFSNTKVKSALSNTGLFDKNSTDIRKNEVSF